MPNTSSVGALTKVFHCVAKSAILAASVLIRLTMRPVAELTLPSSIVAVFLSGASNSEGEDFFLPDEMEVSLRRNVFLYNSMLSMDLIRI